MSKDGINADRDILDVSIWLAFWITRLPSAPRAVMFHWADNVHLHKTPTFPRKVYSPLIEAIFNSPRSGGI